MAYILKHAPHLDNQGLRWVLLHLRRRCLTDCVDLLCILCAWYWSSSVRRRAIS